MINLLQGVRVVETASFVMGPIAGRILADWGAEVIKIEPAVVDSMNPSTADGDRIRGTGMARGVVNGDPCCYEFVNGNKKSVAVNTMTPEGRKIQQKLCASADIVINHLRPADAKKLGIDYDTLSKLHPGIIVASTSGYGHVGVDANRGGFDAVAYASRSGMAMDCTADGTPFIPFFGYGDVPSGTYFALAILAAYIKKLRTGEGEEVTSSLYGCAIWTAGVPIMTAPYGDPYPTPRDGVFPSSKMYKCADGKYIFLMGLIWENTIVDLCKIMDLPKDAPKRWPNYFAASACSKEISDLLDEQFAKHDRDYWVEKLSTTRIPFDVVASFKDVQKDPQAWDAGYLQKASDEYSEGYDTGIPMPPGQFRNAGTPEVKMVRVGENTREELKKIGYTDEQIDKFRAKKLASEGDQFKPDRFNIAKPGTVYNQLYTAMGMFKEEK